MTDEIPNYNELKEKMLQRIREEVGEEQFTKDKQEIESTVNNHIASHIMMRSIQLSYDDVPFEVREKFEALIRANGNKQ